MGENHGGQQDLAITLTGILDIDDDNEPVPENIPANGCYRKSNNQADTQAKLVNAVNTSRDNINLQNGCSLRSMLKM